MELAALASGSSGNCFLVKNKDKAVLIDAGISTKMIIERLAELNQKPEIIKGIFITHEHSDHTRGANVFSKIFSIPIFATKKTFRNMGLCSDYNRTITIKNDETIKIAGMTIGAFPKSHSAADPVSYMIKTDKTAAIITDAGYACNNVIDNVRSSDFLFLESNHDEIMLKNGPYPAFLKKWIRSDEGHMSNMQASLCVLEHASSKLKNIVLSHLSKTNNTPKLAIETFKHLLKERKDLSTRINISERNKTTELFRI